MSIPVTAWAMSAPHRKHYRTGVAGYRTITRLGARDARGAYKAMRRAGIDAEEARGYVVLLLGDLCDFVKQETRS